MVKKRLEVFKKVVAQFTMLQGIILKKADSDKFIHIKETLKSAGVDKAFDDFSEKDVQTEEGRASLRKKADIVSEKVQAYIDTTERKFKMTIEVDGELGTYLASMYDVVQSLPIDILKQDLKEDIITSGFIELVNAVFTTYGEQAQQVVKKGFNNRSQWATTDKTDK